MKRIYGLFALGLVIVAIGAFALFGGFNGDGISSIGDQQTQFSVLLRPDQERLAHQREIVRREAEGRYGIKELHRSEEDIPVLQALLDDNAFLPHQTYELQSLGIVFGDIFDAAPKYSWTMVTDEYGRDAAIRYGETTLQINAPTMISQRVERGETIDVRHLYEETLEAVETAIPNLR